MSIKRFIVDTSYSVDHEKHLFHLNHHLKLMTHWRLAPKAGFSWWEAWGPWWEAWAQWRIWDFRKGLAIELQGFKNWGVWWETPCWWEAWGPGPHGPPKSGPAGACFRCRFLAPEKYDRLTSFWYQLTCTKNRRLKLASVSALLVCLQNWIKTLSCVCVHRWKLIAK